MTAALVFDAFVGRREELNFLCDAHARSLRDGRGAIVLVLGEAGIGKTRLLTEFAARSEERSGAFVRAACEERSSIPFGPFTTILDALADTGSPETRAAALLARSALRDVDAIVVDNPAEQRRQRYGALASALEAAAKSTRQLTLVIEDVHWIDPSSLDVLVAVSSLVARLPLVLVLSGRSDELDRDAARMAGLAKLEGVDRILLGGLERKLLIGPLTKLLPEATRGAVERIYDLSEGKPFVAEELARAVMDRGGRRLDEVPASLRDAVLTRFSRLDVEQQKTLRLASVFGSAFRAEDAASLGIAQSTVVGTLRAARDAGLIDGVEDEFRFRHALTRELLYTDIPEATRTALHRQIADSIEAGASNERLGELAFHRYGAGDLELARRASLDAGDRARKIGAFADAAAHYVRVLDSLQDPRTIAHVATLAIAALQPLGRIDDVVALCERASAKLEAAGLDDDVFDLELLALRTLIFTSRVADMASGVLRIERLLQSSALSAERRFDAECSFCDYRLIVLECDIAKGHIDRADAILPERSFVRENRLLALRGNYLRLTHRYGESADVFKHLRDRAIAAGDSLLLAQTLSNLGFVSEALGELSSGIDYCEESVRVYARLGQLLHANTNRAEAALLAAMRGDYARVRKLFEAATRSGAGTSHAIWTVARMKAVRACGGDDAEFFDLVRNSHGVQPYILAMALWELPWIVAGRREAPHELFDLRRQLVGDLMNGERPYLYAVATLGRKDQFDDVWQEIQGAFDAADPLGRAWSALLRARCEERIGSKARAKALANEAARRFAEVEMPIERAHALEIAGQKPEARALLQRAGADAELARFGALAIAGRRTSGLTPRESEIATMLCAGMSTAALATKLQLSIRTVDAHIGNIYKKLGVRNRVELTDLWQ